MWILDFNSFVEAILEDAIHTLQEQEDINALVLDVRGNQWGEFQSSNEILSLFVEGGKVATSLVEGNNVVLAFKKDESDREGESNENDDDGETKDAKGGKFHPVLRNHGQQSASVSVLYTNHSHGKK